jgi:hypothetical protein
MKKILTNGSIQRALMSEFGVSRPTVNTALKFKKYRGLRYIRSAERDERIRARAIELGGAEVEQKYERVKTTNNEQSL